MPDTNSTPRLPTKPEVTRATAVSKLTAEIKTELTLAKEAGMTMVKHAQRVGELLIELKGRLPHGQYLPHVAQHFGLSKQSAAGYVRLFERRDEIDAGMPLRQALKAISTPREPRTINPLSGTTGQRVVPYTAEEAESDQRRVLEARDVPASDVELIRGQVAAVLVPPAEPVTPEPEPSPTLSDEKQARANLRAGVAWVAEHIGAPSVLAIVADVLGPARTDLVKAADGSLSCSFCGKSQRAVGHLIQGPVALICNECVVLCGEIIAERQQAEAEAVGDTPEAPEGQQEPIQTEETPSDDQLLGWLRDLRATEHMGHGGLAALARLTGVAPAKIAKLLGTDNRLTAPTRKKLFDAYRKHG